MDEERVMFMEKMTLNKIKHDEMQKKLAICENQVNILEQNEDVGRVEIDKLQNYEERIRESTASLVRFIFKKATFK